MEEHNMWGTLFNTFTILIGSALGSIFKKGIKEEYKQILMQALGLAVLALGTSTFFKNMEKSQYPVLFIVSLVLGGLLGQKLDLESRFDRLLAASSDSDLAEGLSTAILLFCIGSLSIMGPVEAALHHEYTFLITNGLLDGITSIILGSTFGIGIALASAVLFVWQGSIYLIAFLLKGAISAPLVAEISIVGGILIFASGLGILNIKKISIVNLLPALAIPIIFFIIISFL